MAEGQEGLWPELWRQTQAKLTVMAYEVYRFRTSNLNWRMGVVTFIFAAALSYLQFSPQAQNYVALVLAGGVALLSVFCFLARYGLTLDVQSGHVKDSSGFWPFAKTRYESIRDFSGLAITVLVGRRTYYTLWLVANDGRRISLCDWDSWPRLNDRAQEISRATGWPVSDTTNGANSLSALLRD